MYSVKKRFTGKNKPDFSDKQKKNWIYH